MFGFLRDVSLPSSRSFEAETCSLARAQRCIWAAGLCPQSAYEAESAIALYRPSVAVGAAWVAKSLYQVYFESTRNVTNRDFVLFT